MLNGMSLLEGATYAPTGGSGITFSATGESVANGVVLANTAETDFFAREKVYATSRMPALQGDGEYSKMKVSARCVRPLVTSGGKTVYNLVRVELEVHPESSASEIGNLKSLGMSMLNDSDMNAFWEVGALQ